MHTHTSDALGLRGLLGGLLRSCARQPIRFWPGGLAELVANRENYGHGTRST